ncbi:MAG: hypothetical protein CM1200mP18_23190 [Gammaproteobacteria bacterium]|nr:MAG: hypothetical protein CM1200mP18_23190 [Gammaproteobacteria bacterium]
MVGAAERGKKAAALAVRFFNFLTIKNLLGEESEIYMGLLIFTSSTFKNALADSDLTFVIGGRLDNQMNFGNPPFFPEKPKLICINGSPEELN